MSSPDEQRNLSVASEDALVTERTNSNASGTALTAARSPKFEFFQKRKSVSPASIAVVESDDVDANAPETLLFLNQTTDFDFRALFRKTSSVGVVAAGAASSLAHKDKRRLRQREELCLMTAKTATRAKKAWFLSPGYIGRDNGEHILVSTKDVGMDAIHAEVLVDGDDYLVRDHNSSSGSYLCLTTINRHHPQRDGFRLRNGDLFLLGNNTKVIVHEVLTTSKQAAKSLSNELDGKLRLERRPTSSSSTGAAISGESEIRMPSSSVSASRRVRFGQALDALDNSPIMGNRYKRKKKKTTSPYEAQVPVGLSISVIVDDQQVNRELQLPGKNLYLIGSSPVCDIQTPSAASDIHPVHARIVFDGVFFVLQDLSFEENPKKKTRVSLQQPTRIGRGDCLLFGSCVLYVVNVYRAFRDHEPDMKEVAFKCHLLRPSKRKSRSKEKYIPFGFRHHTQDPFVFGKGRHCEGHIFTSTLSVEQFAIQLDHGACSLVPRAAGINQGMYFLLGRDCMPHDLAYRPDLVRYTSKALMLVEGSVFKCGNTELEVVYVKSEYQADVAMRVDEVKENAYFLGHMPWIQQIALDRHGVENVAQRGQRLELQPGDTIYDEGDPATFLFIVISGEVQLVGHRSDLPSSWRLSAIEGFLSPPDSSTPLPEPVTEKVGKGSYFGEVCLCGDSLEYAENAKAASPCILLAISREDLCGYFSHYMDIITPHLAYESHKELLQKLRVNVAWLREYSYQELRVLASKAEHVCFEQGESLIEDGLFQINNSQRCGGLLLLGYGKAQLLGKPEPVATTDDEEVTDDGDVKTAKMQELWKASQPIMCSSTVPLDALFHNIKARSRVECFFFDSVHVAHLIRQEQNANGQLVGDIISALPPQLRRGSTNRRSSFVTLQQRARHSQVIMTSANGGADEEDRSLESSGDVEEINDPAQKWRRKKRNKALLEKTILETQQNGDLSNALVMYVLSGANRGDIHIVRNLATVGGILSDADIELNDRYVSRHQAVIQHRESRFWLYDNASEWGTFVRLEENQNIQVYPGDVFISGEVEFTCLAAFPVRKKTQICCIQ